VGTCPACGGSPLEVFFESRGVPVHCNVLHETRADALTAETGDIRLGFCGVCGMIYNVAFDPARMRYGLGYENALHVSERFREYAREAAQGLVDRHGLVGARVVEVGCGDGYFLRLLCGLAGSRGWGFDPSWPGDVTPGDASDVIFVRDGYQSGAVGEDVDLIIGRHVLEHVADPRAFLRSLRATPGRRGRPILFVEVPDARETLNRGAVWDILYEHCSYFTPRSLRSLFRSEGLETLRIAAAFGGQFLQADARPDGAGMRRISRSAEVAALEAAAAGFSEAYAARVGRWRAEVERLRAAGRRVVVWGAGTKGVMFVHTVDAGRAIEEVVDINPKKHGKYVPATGQEVVPPERLQRRPPDVVLVMNPLYVTEVEKRLDGLGITANVRAV
jgi:hypothetical protein